MPSPSARLMPACIVVVVFCCSGSLLSSASLAGIQARKLGGCVHVIVCGLGRIGIWCEANNGRTMPGPRSGISYPRRMTITTPPRFPLGWVRASWTPPIAPASRLTTSGGGARRAAGTRPQGEAGRPSAAAGDGPPQAAPGEPEAVTGEPWVTGEGEPWDGATGPVTASGQPAATDERPRTPGRKSPPGLRPPGLRPAGQEKPDRHRTPPGRVARTGPPGWPRGWAVRSLRPLPG